MAMVDVEIIKQQCVGRWFGILSSFGIRVRDDGRHEACPICQSGTDRFRMEKDGSGYYCNQCSPHAGDTITLIQKCLNIDFPESLKKIQSIVGGCEVQTQKEKPKYDIKKMLNALWNKSNVLTGSDPVSVYLHRRGLVLQPDNVRYCPTCYESDTKTERPAMIARIVGSDNVPLALHRTYLNSEHQKADIKSPKKITPALGSLVGCAVRLFPVVDNEIIVCEGIETAIACRQLFDISAWACLSSTILEGFEPPEGIRKITICADNDASFAGQKSAYILANRLYNKDLIVEVQTPDKPGEDFNDVLKNA
jgi:putative DNA primase/helicase